MNQYVNPYMNPYSMGNYGQMQTAQVMPVQRQVEKVNGKNGALQYPIGANSSAWILDECGEISWLIQTDSAGYKTVTPYDVAPHQDVPVPNYGDLENRITKLEEIINGNAANTTATRKKPAGKPDDGDD